MVHIVHVRHPFREDRYIGTVAVDDQGFVGWSQCHPKDTFSKKIGRAIAIGRSKKTGDIGKPVTYKAYNEDGSVRERLDPIRDALNRLRKRVFKNYFNQQVA